MMGKMSLEKNRGRIWTAAMVFVLLLVVLAAAALRMEKTTVEGEALDFTSERWDVESGKTLGGNSELISDKDADAGENRILYRTKASFDNYKLSFEYRYSGTNREEPWMGCNGLILNDSADSLDGFYVGFYDWGGALYCSTGYYRNGEFAFLYGNHTGWDTAGAENNVYEIYVQGDLANVVINGWIFTSFSLPYRQGGYISLLADGCSGVYKNLTVTPLDSDFCLASKLVRANWGGYNICGAQYYFYETGKNQTFQMRLPDDLTQVKKYYLARQSKLADLDQDVEVYLDKTGKLTLADEWTDKIADWGDSAYGNRDFGLNTVALDPSRFEGLGEGENAGFFLKKNTDGWYSACEYWLLWENAAGEIFVSDYFDMAYEFDKQAHSYASAEPSSYFFGYQFIAQDNAMLVSRMRGAKAEILRTPEIAKKGDIEYTFALDEKEKVFDLKDYVSVKTNHFSCQVRYFLDGAETDEIVLPNDNAEGTILVEILPAGANDASGNLDFGEKKVTISYKTIKTVEETYLEKISDIEVFAAREGQTLELLDYVRTNAKEGEWSYSAFGGEFVSGTEFSVPFEEKTGPIVLRFVSAQGEELRTELTYSSKKIVVKSPPSLPYLDACDSVSDFWTPLSEAPVAVKDGKYVSSAENRWSAIADTGLNSYMFQFTLNVAGAQGDRAKHGVLLHAFYSLKGLNGTLVGFELQGDKLMCSVGYYADGKYTEYAYKHTYFNGALDYIVKITVEGSAVQLMINGWNTFQMTDKYSAGTGIALLNGDAEISYDNFVLIESEGSMDEFVFREDWKGADTYQKNARFSSPFTLFFKTLSGGTNYRLARRTPLGETAQAAEIYADGQSYGTWKTVKGEQYGDVFFGLPDFSPQGAQCSIRVEPRDGNVFSASYLWLICEKDGRDYIADCVYFPYEYDALLHGVTEIPAVDASDTGFVATGNEMILNTATGEEVRYAANDGVLGKMQALTYSDKKVSQTTTLPYRLYLPENYDSSKKYPVLLYLHGAGERGSDNMAQVAGSNLGVTFPLKRIIFGSYRNDVIIVAPQCPLDKRWVETDWTPGGYKIDEVPQSVPSKLAASLLYNEIFQKYSVDLSRVYGAGISMGGFGITDMAMRYPDLFAAIVNSAGGADSGEFALLSTTALAGYNSNSDTTVGYEALAQLCGNMKDAGLDARYTHVEDIGHLSWLVAYQDAELLHWLFSKTKKWTVEVNAFGGSLNGDILDSFGIDQERVVLPDAYKEGLTFAGWYTDAGYQNAIAEFDGSIARNLTLYAKYVKNITVSFSDGEKIIDTLETTDEEEVDLSKISLQKEGYTLTGWSDGTNDYSLTEPHAFGENVTLTPKWSVNRYVVKIYDGETELFNESYDYGTSPEIAPLQKAGYRLEGYYKEADFSGEKVSLPQTVTGDLLLYTKWIPEQTTSDGETSASDSVSGSSSESDSRDTASDSHGGSDGTVIGGCKGCGGVSVPLAGGLALLTAAIFKRRKNR